MTVQDLGSLGELIAAIATVVTLAYLAIQIRHNTKAARIAAIQAAVEGSADWNAMIAEDGELGDLFWNGMADPDSLDVTQRRRFIAFLVVFLRRESLTYYLHQEGNMPEKMWQARVRSFSSVLNQPGMHVCLETAGDTLPNDFRDFLADLISQESTMTETARRTLGTPIRHADDAGHPTT